MKSFGTSHHTPGEISCCGQALATSSIMMSFLTLLASASREGRRAQKDYSFCNRTRIGPCSVFDSIHIRYRVKAINTAKNVNIADTAL